jgi:hypothetical protein
VKPETNMMGAIDDAYFDQSLMHAFSRDLI